MAGMCFGMVGDGEAVAPADPSSSIGRIMEPLPFKSFADVVAKASPLENGRKRPRVVEICHRESDEDDSGSRVSSRRRVKEGSSGADSKGRREAFSVNASTEGLSGKLEENGEVSEFPKFGLTSVCGRRRDMEDAVLVKPSLCGESNGIFHFYGLFDGHGCSHVAMKCKSRMHEIVKEEIERYEERSIEWSDAMMRSFRRMDEEADACCRDSPNGPNCRCELQTPRCDAVGSTAIVAVVTPEKIVVSNCGDSRAVLCRNGVAIPMSSDHKPDRPDELARIQNAGGRVIYWDGARVFGVLAMSRAIGDNYLKPFVIPDPEVTVTGRTEEDECLILASDGLWDVVSNETACGVARMCLRAQKPSSPPRSPGSDVGLGPAAESADKACSDASILLTKLALARHSSDNVSVVVVDLRRDNRGLL